MASRFSPRLVNFGLGVSRPKSETAIGWSLARCDKLAGQLQGPCDKLATAGTDGNQHVGIHTSPDNWYTCYFFFIIIIVIILFLLNFVGRSRDTMIGSFRVYSTKLQKLSSWTISEFHEICTICCLNIHLQACKLLAS